MDRRDFLKAAGAAALALGAAAPRERKMLIALTPGSIGVGAASQKQLNELAARHGFEAVEPRTAELAAMSAEQLAELKADLAAKKLAWAAAGLPVDFRKDDALFREGVAKLPSLAAGLQRAGATRVGTWLSPSHAELTYLQNFKRHAERLREVAKILKDHGVRFGLEYVGTQTLRINRRYAFVHSMAETRELIAEIGTGNVGVVPDSWHWWQAGDTEADLLALRNEDVVSVDLNDAPAGVAKEAQKDGARELPCATGVIDLAAFVNALQKLGYDGPVRPEPFNKALNDLDDEAACAASAAALKKAMALVR